MLTPKGKKKSLVKAEKRKSSQYRQSIESNDIELSELSDITDRKRNKSELSARLLPPEKNEAVTQHISQLTMEEVIAKVFPEFSKYDPKKNKNTVNWRHFDKSALQEIFGEAGRKTIYGGNFIDKLSVSSRDFFHGASISSVEGEKDENDAASNQLSYKKLQQYIDDQHPRDEYISANNKRRKRKFSLCIPTGSYFFENEENELEKYGLGITLYFKYVKYLIVLFLVLFVFNLPALLIFFFNRNSFPVRKSTDTLNNFLFKTTFGNIGGEEEICARGSYAFNEPTQQRLHFECPEHMRLVGFFGFALRNSSTCMINKEEFNTIVDKDYRDTCGNEILSKINITQCVHETTCTLRFDVKSLPQQCRINSDIFSPSEDPYLVGYATCEEFHIDVPWLKTLEKKKVYYLLVVIDLASVLIFSIGYFWVRNKEKEEEALFKKNLLSSEQYTLKIAGFKKITNIWLYINDLISHLQTNCPQVEDITIADVNFVTFDKEYLDTKRKIGSTLRKTHTLEVLIEKARKDNVEASLTRGLLEMHYKYDIELNNLYKQIEKIELHVPIRVKYIFLTFNKAQTSEDIIQRFYEPSTKRTLSRIFSSADQEPWRYFQGARLIVKRAPPNTNIRWTAISKSKFVHEFRKISIFLIELVLIFFIFYYLMFLQIEVNYNVSLLGQTECPKLYDQTEVIDNWDNKQILKCYCEQTFQGTLEEKLIKSQNTYFTQGAFQCPIEVPASDPSNYYQNHSPCYDYFKIVDKFQHPSDWLMLNYGSKLAIAVSNGLICLVSIVFAKFMRRPTISSELKQSAIGAFIMQVLNLGWLALLSNIGSFKKIWSYFSPPFEPLFRVMCQDFTINFEGHSLFTLDWFFTNGTGVIVTFLMSAFTYHFGIILLFLAFHLYRWYDKGFTFNPRKTRKLIQSDYNKVHKGPVIALDNSYATILTFIFVIMMFATALPLLYLIAAMAFGILYWVDKYLQLRFYCNPPRFDDRFAVLIRKMIPVSILFHLAFAILIFGSIHLSPPATSNLADRAADFILVNGTITQEIEQKAKVLDLFADIAIFYSQSMTQPFVAVLGILTVILFFVIVLKMIFGDIIKVLIRNIHAYKGIYSRSLSGTLEMDFVAAVETSYLSEKIQVMKKQKENSNFPLEFGVKFNKMLEMYEKEFKRRNTRQTFSRLKQYMKDMPFYSMELSEEYRKKFGFEYTRNIKYHKNRRMSDEDLIL